MHDMPARAIGTASVSFGLVAIPVKLYPATEASASVSFNLLHEECKGRLKQQYHCPRCNVLVLRENMVKGYEFAKDQYVTFAPAELKALEERATGAIEISEFVPLDKVDPVFFDKPYYLAAEKGGEKAYHLLAEVMRESGRSALAKYAARGKQYLVLLRAVEGGIVMQQLLYNDEVRAISEVPMADVPEVKDIERKLAHQLVDQISSETFNPAAYKDEVKERILADIQKKVDGQEIAVQEETETPAQIIDLMEALKASLEAGKSRAGAGGETVRKPARRVESEVDAGDGEPDIATVAKAAVRRVGGKKR